MGYVDDDRVREREGQVTRQGRKRVRGSGGGPGAERKRAAERWLRGSRILVQRVARRSLRPRFVAGGRHGGAVAVEESSHHPYASSASTSRAAAACAAASASSSRVSAPSVAPALARELGLLRAEPRHRRHRLEQPLHQRRRACARSARARRAGRPAPRRTARAGARTGRGSRRGRRGPAPRDTPPRPARSSDGASPRTSPSRPIVANSAPLPRTSRRAGCARCLAGARPAPRPPCARAPAAAPTSRAAGATSGVRACVCAPSSTSVPTTGLVQSSSGSAAVPATAPAVTHRAGQHPRLAGQRHPAAPERHRTRRPAPGAPAPPPAAARPHAIPGTAVAPRWLRPGRRRVPIRAAPSRAGAPPPAAPTAPGSRRRNTSVSPTSAEPPQAGHSPSASGIGPAAQEAGASAVGQRGRRFARPRERLVERRCGREPLLGGGAPSRAPPRRPARLGRAAPVRVGRNPIGRRGRRQVRRGPLGQVAGQRVVEREPQRVHIRARVAAAAREHLRRGVGQRAGEGAAAGHAELSRRAWPSRSR